MGTVSENSLIGGRVIGINGVCFTLMAGTHGYGQGNYFDTRFITKEELNYWLKEFILVQDLED